MPKSWNQGGAEIYMVARTCMSVSNFQRARVNSVASKKDLARATKCILLLSLAKEIEAHFSRLGFAPEDVKTAPFTHVS